MRSATAFTITRNALGLPTTGTWASRPSATEFTINRPLDLYIYRYFHRLRLRLRLSRLMRRRLYDLNALDASTTLAA
ncbi:hypothetical protein SLA2020_000090 [Shorea laevis]